MKHALNGHNAVHHLDNRHRQERNSQKITPQAGAWGALLNKNSKTLGVSYHDKAKRP